MNTDKKRKKGTITPTQQPPKHTGVTPHRYDYTNPYNGNDSTRNENTGNDSMANDYSVSISPISPPPPDTTRPVFKDTTPSLLKALFKSVLFCIPTAIIAIGVILFYAQDQVVNIIPEMKTVYRTLNIVHPYTSFAYTQNTPQKPLVAHITQVIVQGDDTHTRLYGIIYNTTAHTPYESATVTLEFLTDNNTLITTSSHLIISPMPPSVYTAFEIPLEHIPSYATHVQIKDIQ